jgi:hypothetical protein
VWLDHSKLIMNVKGKHDWSEIPFVWPLSFG